MFRVSNSVYLRDKRLNDEYYDIKYNQVNRIDLRKCADFTNETPEQITDNNFTPPAPPSPSAPPVQTNDYNIQQNDNQNNTEQNNTEQNDVNNQNTMAKKESLNFKGVEDAKTMYQNGLISAIAPTSDYWEDNSYESYVPHSDWNSPSSAIWSPAATNLYGRY